MARLRHRKLIATIVTITFLVAGALALAQDQETLRIKTEVAAEDPAFPAYLARLLGHPLTSGDSYIAYEDGGQAFPAMLAAIDRAQSRISLETYILDSDDTGRKFVDALERAARRGVSVQVVLDAVGSKLEKPDIARLENAGVRIGWYNRVASYSLEEANYRTHRKELVVDGRVAFVGGMGFADQWAHDVEGEARWRDTQVELSGPAVDNIEAGFYENWMESGGVVKPVVQPAFMAP